MAVLLQTPIGQMTTRVRIEQAAPVSDGQGGQTAGWALRAELWALVEPLLSREALMAKAATAVLNTALTLHYRNDVAITDRVLIKAPGARTYYGATGLLVPRTRVLRPQSYQDTTGRRAELRLLCAETEA